MNASLQLYIWLSWKVVLKDINVLNLHAVARKLNTAVFATSVWKTLITIANGWTPAWVVGTTGKMASWVNLCTSCVSFHKMTCGMLYELTSGFVCCLQVLLCGTVLCYTGYTPACCCHLVHIYSALSGPKQPTDGPTVWQWVTMMYCKAFFDWIEVALVIFSSVASLKAVVPSFCRYAEE